MAPAGGLHAPASSALEELPSGPLRVFAVRIFRGLDFIEELERIVNDVMSACSPAVFVLSCNGNLRACELEMGRAESAFDKLKQLHEKTLGDEIEEVVNIEDFTNPVQIVSLTGNFSRVFDNKSNPRIHSNLTICVSDNEGKVRSGLLVSGQVLNSVEIVLGCIQGVEFERKVSGNTGEQELYVSQIEVVSDEDAAAVVSPKRVIRKKATRKVITKKTGAGAAGTKTGTGGVTRKKVVGGTTTKKPVTRKVVKKKVVAPPG